MVAIQSFRAINAEMEEVQLRLTTGRRINGPKDNPAIWAIAQNQRAEARALDAVKSSLNRGQSAVNVGITAGETVSDLLIEMKAKAVAAKDYPLGDPSRQALDDEYLALRKQIDTAVNNAEFGGINLVSAGGTGAVRALANTQATSTIDVNHVDLSTTGAILAGLPSDLQGGLGAGGIDAINAALEGVNAAVSRLGTGAKALATHLTFVDKLQQTIEGAIGNLVDADLAKEAARFEALQVRQQLAIIAMRIANQQPSLLLQLFRTSG